MSFKTQVNQTKNQFSDTLIRSLSWFIEENSESNQKKMLLVIQVILGITLILLGVSAAGRQVAPIDEVPTTLAYMRDRLFIPVSPNIFSVWCVAAGVSALHGIKSRLHALAVLSSILLYLAVTIMMVINRLLMGIPVSTEVVILYASLVAILSTILLMLPQSIYTKR